MWLQFKIILIYFFIHLILNKSLYVSAVGDLNQLSSNKAGINTIELSASDLKRHLNKWENDLLIHFYSPFGSFYRHMVALCDQLARFFESRDANSLLITQFNCKLNAEHKALCDELEVSEYPTLYFVGYGKFRNFSRLSKLSIFKQKTNLIDRIVKYHGEPFMWEKLRDWLRIMHWISLSHRWRTKISFSFEIFSPFSACDENRLN